MFKMYTQLTMMFCTFFKLIFVLHFKVVGILSRFHSAQKGTEIYSNLVIIFARAPYI